MELHDTGAIPEISRDDRSRPLTSWARSSFVQVWVWLLYLISPWTMTWTVNARGQEPLLRQVVVLDSEGRKHAGPLQSISESHVVVGDSKPTRLATKDLIRLTCKDRKSIVTPGGPLVLLTSGSTLALSVDAIRDDLLVGHFTRFVTWPQVKIPLEVVRGAILGHPADATDAARLWLQLSEHRETRDQLILGNGDLLSGEFLSLSESVEFNGSAGKTLLDRRGVLAVAFNPELTTVEAGRDFGVLVSLTDGSTFRATVTGMTSGDRVALKPEFGAAYDIPLSAIESLRFLGGRAAYLSDLKPADYRFEPYFSLEWPWRADRSVAGGPLRLRGIQFPKGLGLHSRAELTYDLQGNYGRFESLIGIDDATGGQGSALFEVLVDGKSTFRSEPLGGGDEPFTIPPIRLTGARKLTLRVDYGLQADVLDHANWCDALLIRSE